MAITYFTVGTGKMHADPQSAIDAVPGNLLGLGEQRVEVYAGGAQPDPDYGYYYYGRLDFDTGFSNESEPDFVSMHATVSHGGKRDKGIVIKDTDASGKDVIKFGPYSQVHGVGITIDIVTSNGAGVRGVNFGTSVGCVADSCIIYDIVLTGNVSTAYGVYSNVGATWTVRNCAIINMDATHRAVGLYMASTLSCEAFNCSVQGVVNHASGNWGYGIYIRTDNATVKNCVAADCEEADFKDNIKNPTVEYCVSSDDTANDWGGVGNQINKDSVTDVMFTSITAGTQDLHILEGSCAKDVGVELSTEGFSTDIEGNPRPHGLFWDVGAYEYTPPADCRLVRLPDAYYGKHALLAHSPGEHCYQDVNIGTGDYVLSARTRCYGWGTGEAVLTAQFLDQIDGANMGDPSSVTGYPQETWDLLRMDLSTPAGATALRTSLSRNSDDDVLFDALQLSLSGELDQFGFVSPSATIEYETDPTGVYEYRNRPYDVDDVDLNPVYNAISRGFLTIGEYIDDPHTEPVGKGGHCVLPDVTGHFVAYRGTGEDPLLAGYSVAIFDSPVGLPPHNHFLDSYPVLTGQAAYSFLNVGSVTEDMYEYAGAFTAGATSYPSGIQDEDWVIPGPVSGEYPIDLDEGSSAWLDVLKWRLQNIVLDNSGTLSGVYDFDGIMYEGMHYADQFLPQLGNQREEMAALVGSLHEWASSQSGEGELLLGVSNGLGVVRHAVSNAETILDDLDAILIDGLSVLSGLSYATTLERNRTRAQVLHTLRDQAYRGSGEAEVFALDHITSNPANLTGEPGISMRAIDEDIIRLSTHFCAIERWYYGCGTEGLTGVYEPPLATGLYDYGIGEYIEPTGECVGRVHMPWSKLSGHNKLVQRGVFHPVNTGVNEDYTHPDDIPQPAAMTIASVLSAYDELDVRPAHVHGIEDGAVWVDWHFYGMKIGDNTTVDGKVRVDLSVAVVSGAIVRVLVIVYSDLAGTVEVARGERNKTTGAEPETIPIPLSESNSSGLSGIALVDVPVTGPLSTTFYPQFADPWSSYRANAGDALFMSLRHCTEYAISAIVRDQFGNPVDHALVYASTSTGSLDCGKKRTDRSGVVSFTLTLSSLSTTGVGSGLLQLVCPRGRLEQHVYIDIAGCKTC